MGIPLIYLQWLSDLFEEGVERLSEYPGLEERTKLPRYWKILKSIEQRVREELLGLNKDMALRSHDSTAGGKTPKLVCTIELLESALCSDSTRQCKPLRIGGNGLLNPMVHCRSAGRVRSSKLGNHPGVRSGARSVSNWPHVSIFESLFYDPSSACAIVTLNFDFRA